MSARGTGKRVKHVLKKCVDMSRVPPCSRAREMFTAYLLGVYALIMFVLGVIVFGLGVCLDVYAYTLRAFSLVFSEGALCCYSYAEHMTTPAKHMFVDCEPSQEMAGVDQVFKRGSSITTTGRKHVRARALR